MALLTSAEENSLPSSKFAAVYTSVTTKNGRTTRTTVRKLPIHDASHVRNALARFDQTDLPTHIKSSARAKLLAAAKKFGVEVS